MRYAVVRLLAFRQFCQAVARLFGILLKSDPMHGWPLLRAFLDVLERVSADAHAETVAPALKAFLIALESKSPGVLDAVLHPRNRPDHPDSRPVEPAAGTAGRA